MSATAASIISLTVSAIIIICIIAAAHYLQQIRDELRAIHEAQKKLAARLGARV